MTSTPQTPHPTFNNSNNIHRPNMKDFIKGELEIFSTSIELPPPKRLFLDIFELGLDRFMTCGCLDQEKYIIEPTTPPLSQCLNVDSGTDVCQKGSSSSGLHSVVVDSSITREVSPLEQHDHIKHLLLPSSVYFLAAAYDAKMKLKGGDLSTAASSPSDVFLGE